MLTGKRFELSKATLALDVVNGKHRAVTIPAGTIIQVASGPADSDGMVNVVWQERKVEMFLVDLTARGAEITDKRAKA